MTERILFIAYYKINRESTYYCIILYSIICVNRAIDIINYLARI